MPKRASQSSRSTKRAVPAEGDGAPAVLPLSLRMAGDRAGPLSKARKRFDVLLRRVETLRAEKVRMATRWEKFLHAYRERIHPEERRMVERRKQAVGLLEAFWRAPKGLGSRQRDNLEELLRAQLRLLLETEGALLDAELRQLWRKLNPADAVEGDGGGGPDADAADPEKAGAESSGAGPEGDGSEEGDAGGSATGAQHAEPESRRAAEHVSQREEARKRTVVGIYKQLAKALHPDLERDPVLRERKHSLMQDLNKAYREGDLHTLLRLELEWITREEGDLEKLGDEKLGIYSELLEEQVADLQAELREVAFSPRFAAVSRFMDPMTGAPCDLERILLALRQQSEAVKRFRDALDGPEGREALRTILQEVAEERRRTRVFWEDEGF